MTRALLVVALLPACYVVPRPSPALPGAALAGLDTRTRQRLYQDYHLEIRRCGLGTTLARADGTYSYLGLKDVVGRYPDSRAVYERAAHRDEVLVNLLIWGIALAATAGIDHLAEAADGSGQLGSGGRIGLYSVGGALVLSTLVAMALWDDPITELPSVYNQELRADLGLGAVEVRTASLTGKGGCP